MAAAKRLEGLTTPPDKRLEGLTTPPDKPPPPVDLATEMERRDARIAKLAQGGWESRDGAVDRTGPTPQAGVEPAAAASSELAASYDEVAAVAAVEAASPERTAGPPTLDEVREFCVGRDVDVSLSDGLVAVWKKKPVRRPGWGSDPRRGVARDPTLVFHPGPDGRPDWTDVLSGLVVAEHGDGTSAAEQTTYPSAPACRTRPSRFFFVLMDRPSSARGAAAAGSRIFRRALAAPPGAGYSVERTTPAQVRCPVRLRRLGDAARRPRPDPAAARGRRGVSPREPRGRTGRGHGRRPRRGPGPR